MKRLLTLILAALTLLFASCGAEKATSELYAMDTYIMLTAEGKDASTAVKNIENAIRTSDTAFSVSSVSGEIKMLLENGELDNPSQGLLKMLSCAKTLWERTDGAYDVTAYALSEAWGFYAENKVPSGAEIEQALALVGMDKIEFDENSVRLNGVKGIDLGSVAKGYTGDKTVEAMQGLDVDCALITLGGNVVTYGAKSDGTPFKIGVTDPASPDDVIGYLSVGATNVVTSGKYNRNFTYDGKTYHHIIDARTGYPCENGVAQVTVICEDGTWADALSTALFLLGTDGALEYYRTYGGFEAVIVTETGEIVLTDGAKDIFTKL